jgi:predicted DNA-binding protein with PD1-like motif
MQYHPLGDGHYAMRLDPGDEIIACLRQFAGEESVEAGYVTGLGSTSLAVLSWLDPETGEYARRRFEEPMEVATLSGTFSVSAEDGRPFVHLHAVMAPRELLAYAGHVHEARTGVVMELFIFTFKQRLERHSLPDKPFPWLLMPSEPRPSGGDAGP